MQIAHISDLHLDCKFKEENINKTQKLFNYFKEINLDHVVITGDISHNAKMTDYLSLKNILINTGFWNSDKCTIIIGNHDIFGGVVTAEDVLDFPNKCKEVDFEAKVKEFFNVFKELFRTAIFPENNNIFPFTKIVKDVVFVGLNSIEKYSYLKNLFASNGKVNKTQREDFEKLASNFEFDNKLKICLIHHHFSKFYSDSLNIKNPLWNKIENATMKLRAKKKLIKSFNKYNIKNVMHGHVHQMHHYIKDDINFYNAGCSIDNYQEGKINFNYFTINNQKITHQNLTLPQEAPPQPKLLELYLSEEI